MKPEATPEETKSGGRKPKSKTRLVILLVIVGVLVVGMALATYFFLLKSGPDQVVRMYVVAESTGDYATMRTLLSEDSASLLPPDDQLPPQSEESTLPQMDIGKPVIEGTRATVPVKIKQEVLGAFAGEQELTIVLGKEQGQWKVDLKATVMEEYERRMGGAGLGGPPSEGPAPELRAPAQPAPPAEPTER